MSAHPWPWRHRKQHDAILSANGGVVAVGDDETWQAILAMRAEAYAAGYAAGQEAMRGAAKAELRTRCTEMRTTSRLHAQKGRETMELVTDGWADAYAECIPMLDAIEITRNAKEPPR